MMTTKSLSAIDSAASVGILIVVAYLFVSWMAVVDSWMPPSLHIFPDEGPRGPFPYWRTHALRYWPLALAAGVALYVVRRGAQRRLKLRRDSLANEFVTISDGQDVRVRSTDYVLLLRPFFTDGAMVTKSYSLSVRSWFRNLSLQSLKSGGDRDFELALLEALAPKLNVFKIGEIRNHHASAGRIDVSDDDWVRAFQALAHHADAILLVPIAQPATLFELRHIVEHALIEKTVLLMPYSPTYKKNAYAPDGANAEGPRLHKPREIWEDSRARIRSDVGLELPKHRSRGGMFVWVGDRWKEITGVSGQPWDSWRTLRWLIVERRVRCSIPVAAIRATLAMLWSVIALAFVGMVVGVIASFMVGAAEGDISIGVVAMACGALLGVLRCRMAYRRFALGPTGATVLSVAVVAGLVAGLFGWAAILDTIYPPEGWPAPVLVPVLLAGALLGAWSCAALAIWRLLPSEHWGVPPRTP